MHQDETAQGVIVLSRDMESRYEFAESVARGLTDSPPWLHCKYFYDEHGSHLFEEISRQPEYYLTRTEDAILAEHAGAIRDLTGPVTLIELGSGSSAKTDRLLEAYAAGGREVLYVPVDVSEAALTWAHDDITARRPTVTVTGIAGTYESAFPLFERFSPSMVVFLGSTIGNFNAQEADAFWQRVQEALRPGDYFLLGVDLVKDKGILDAAYNDAAGRTAAFTKNLFARINRDLGADVNLRRLQHVASFNPELNRIETFVRFLADQDVYLEPLDQTISVAAGTMVMTEISRKFHLPQLQENLQLYGLDTRRVFTDPKEWFAVVLLQRRTD